MTTTIEWDAVGSRTYEAGVDRGVLFMPGVPPVPWNGLTGVDVEADGAEVTPYYQNGVRYLLVAGSTDFSGKIKAFTYPDVFLPAEGVRMNSAGVYYDNQQPVPFGLCYRTKIGTDTDPDAGYKIHLLYDQTATPDSKGYQTVSNQTDPVEFNWSITGIPSQVASGLKPTAHLVIDSRQLSSARLAFIEAYIYGDGVTTPQLPTPEELYYLMNEPLTAEDLVITDNGDGTWTATSTDGSITMLDAATFQIITQTATYLDSYTYTISSA